MKLRSALAVAILSAMLPAMAQAQSGPPTLKPGAAGQSSGQTPGAAPSTQSVDPTKVAAIRHLMDVTGSAKLGDQIGAFITNQVRQGVSRGIQPEDRLQKFMDEFTKGFSTRFKSGQVDDSAVAIYAANLSLEDIQGITQFYESPVGQHMIKALPSIVQQSQNAGMQAANQAAMETLRSMSEAYPELKTLLPQDPSIAPTPGPGAQPPSNSGNPPKLTPIPQPQH